MKGIVGLVMHLAASLTNCYNGSGAFPCQVMPQKRVQEMLQSIHLGNNQ